MTEGEGREGEGGSEGGRGGEESIPYQTARTGEESRQISRQDTKEIRETSLPNLSFLFQKSPFPFRHTGCPRKGKRKSSGLLIFLQLYLPYSALYFFEEAHLFVVLFTLKLS